MKCAKANAQPELGGERAAVIGGAEQPDLGHRVDFRLQARGTMLSFQQCGQLPDLLGEALGVRKVPAADRLRGARVAAGRAADAEVDAAGIQGLQHAEGLGGAESAVVGKQHAAGADAQAARFRAQPCEQDLGARVGERRDGMVLGEPVAVIAQLVGAARERERFLDRPARAEPADDRGLVQDRQLHLSPLPDRNNP